MALADARSSRTLKMDTASARPLPLALPNRADAARGGYRLKARRATHFITGGRAYADAKPVDSFSESSERRRDHEKRVIDARQLDCTYTAVRPRSERYGDLTVCMLRKAAVALHRVDERAVD